MPTGPYLCFYQMLSKSFKPHTQGFTSSLEIHSGEVTRKQPQQRLSLLHMTHLLFDTNVSTKYHQNMSRGYQSYGHQDFGFREDNYIIKKKVRVVSLPCDTSSSLPNIIILSQTVWELWSAWDFGKVRVVSCMLHASPSFLPNIIKICLRVSKLWNAQDFGFRGDDYIMKKKVRVVSLTCDMPAGPPLNLYQILSYYLEQYGSYRLH